MGATPPPPLIERVAKIGKIFAASGVAAGAQTIGIFNVDVINKKVSL